MEFNPVTHLPPGALVPVRRKQRLSRSTLFKAATVLALVGIVCVFRASSDSTTTDASSSQWALAGQNASNTRSQANEHKLVVANAASLNPKWSFTSGSDISATPTVYNGVVYVPDWSGHLYAVNRLDGSLVWSHTITEYDKYPNSLSRTSPAVHGSDLIIGDIEDSAREHLGANIIAVTQQTGALRWITQVDQHPGAIITGSPVVYQDTIYVGVASIEENLAVPSYYPCCTFRGSVVALDANTGKVLWKTYTAPDNQGAPGGYSGNAIWQPPAIDPIRGLLYIGTGNNYEVPDSVQTCLSTTSGSAQSACFAADDYFDSALALDLQTGAVKWSRRLQGIDVWTVACIRNPNPVACPIPSSPDYDLSGSGPNLLPNIVGFAQKSGIYWALNPDNGQIVWSTVVGPGGTSGGIQWGTATDGQRIYAAVSNSTHAPYQLINGQTITYGAWSALDVATGKILWQTADPSQNLAMGAVSQANGLVFAGSISGNMYAFDASNGNIVWTFFSGGSVIDGPSISDGLVFWGSGYRKFTSGGIGNNKLYAFTAGN